MDGLEDTKLGDLLTAQQAADFLGMSLDGTYRAIKAGRLRAEKFGAMFVIERSEAQAYKEARARIWGKKGA